MAREGRENAEEWMGHLSIEESECDYKEKVRKLKELFINGMNDDDMMTEIIRELTTIKKTNEITSDQVLCWAKGVKADELKGPDLMQPKIDTVQRTEQKVIAQTTPEETDKYPQTNADTVTPYMSHSGAQYMGMLHMWQS